jgi:hypothetical protein
MKRILIIITRMYAARGDTRDEFVEVWHGGVNTEHRIFTCQTDAQQEHILILHGYEYPQNIERATERARASIETALRSTELLNQLRGSRVGVVFHPRQSWAPAAQRKIAEGVTAYLQEHGAVVDFVESYHHGSVLERRLALACLERRGWVAELNELWPYFLQPTMARFEQRFGALVHDLQNILLPIREDLNTWRRYDLDEDMGYEVLQANKELAPTALDRARMLALEDEEDAQSIAKLTWEVADRLEEGSKQGLVTSLAELEKLFAPGDPRYSQAERLLSTFAPVTNGSAAQKSLDDARLAALRAQLSEANPLDMWFQALVKVLDDLHRTWAK